jgi:hypothetical protein
MPPTRCVRTGSGGWHLYYRHPGGALAAKLHGHDGIDLKADGGYVVAPPSVHPDTGKAYQRIGDRAVIEMPPPLVAACRPIDPPAAPAATVTPMTTGRGISSPAALLQAHLDAVARAPEGRRRDALYHAGRAAGQSDRDTRAAITGGFRAEAVAVERLAA